MNSNTRDRHSIGIIMTWFGPLPDYFPVWLKGAESNSTIDFLCFTDHAFESSSPNIHLHLTTMEKEIARISEATGEEINIKNSYKFCDLRPFFGLGYQEYLRNYEFWGYCDIDMVFGNLREFITDDKLDKYDRFYEFGYLSLFRNNETMNHLYDLPGGIYTRDAIFRSPVKVNCEEHFGTYRICEINHIKWYREKDFADFFVHYSSYLLNQRSNHELQTFYWEDGHVFLAYWELGKVKTEEVAFLHWQKRKPILSDKFFSTGSFFLTPTRIFEKAPGLPSMSEIIETNPPLSIQEKKEQDRKYLLKKFSEFKNTNFAQKRMWIRQKYYFFKKNKVLIESKERL